MDRVAKLKFQKILENPRKSQKFFSLATLVMEFLYKKPLNNFPYWENDPKCPDDIPHLERRFGIDRVAKLKSQKILENPRKFQKILGNTRNFSFYFGFGDSKQRNTVGRVRKSLEVKILDDNEKEVKSGEIGEIYFYSPDQVRGYLNQPDLKWLATGDLGSIGT